MLRKLIPAIALTAVAAMVFATGPAFADDATKSEPTAVETANPGLSRQVLESLPPVVKASSVKIDSSYTPGTPIVYPDGTLVPGQSATMQAKAAASCGGRVVALGNGAWSPSSVSNCSVFGSPGWKVTYSWSRAFGVYTTGCVRAKAYNASGTSYWVSAGCGTSSYVNAPWGNILGVPAVQAFSQGPPAGFTADWSH